MPDGAPHDYPHPNRLHRPNPNSAVELTPMIAVENLIRTAPPQTQPPARAATAAYPDSVPTPTPAPSG